MNFKDQYKHPNWQRVRLEALEAANFTCQRCGSSEEQLHVHHKRYIKGRMIWEYSGVELEALCEPCHAESHRDKELLQALIARLPSDAITDIYSLLSGYCSHVEGPACLHEIDLQSVENPDYFHLGKLAAAIDNKSYRLADVTDAFDGVEAISKSNGGIVEINFTARPRSEFEVVF